MLRLVARVRAAAANREHWRENSGQGWFVEKMVIQCFLNSSRCWLAVDGRLTSSELSGSSGGSLAVAGD